MAKVDAVEIEALLVWTYRDQKADRASSSQDRFERWLAGGGSFEQRAIEIAALGCRIDTPPASVAGLSEAHPDAMLVHDLVSADGQGYAARSLGALVIEHARGASQPDWRAGWRCRAEAAEVEAGAPVVTREAEMAWIDKERCFRRVAWRTYVALLWHDTPEEIVFAREMYSRWWLALEELAKAINQLGHIGRGLSKWSKVTHHVPRMPWGAGEDARVRALAAEIRAAQRQARTRGEGRQGGRFGTHTIALSA